jgi:hypothetical protein
MNYELGHDSIRSPTKLSLQRQKSRGDKLSPSQECLSFNLTLLYESVTLSLGTKAAVCSALWCSSDWSDGRRVPVCAVTSSSNCTDRLTAAYLPGLWTRTERTEGRQQPDVLLRSCIFHESFCLQLVNPLLLTPYFVTFVFPRKKYSYFRDPE